MLERKANASDNHPIRAQILAETKQYGVSQIILPIGAGMGTLIASIILNKGESTSFTNWILWVIISTTISLVVYYVMAAIRGPLVVLAQCHQAVIELQASVARLESTLHDAPDIIVNIKECYIIPSSRTAECFLSITLTNSTDIPCANLSDYAFTLTIDGKDYQTDTLLPLYEFYLSTFDLVERYTDGHYPEPYCEEVETGKDSMPDIRQSRDELDKGYPIKGWLGFRLRNLPDWPYDEEVTGCHSEWVFGEDGEPLEEVPVDEVVKTIRIDSVERGTLKVIDWYNKPHFGKTDGPFERRGKRIRQRPKP